MKYNRVKGTEDFYPEAKDVQNRVFSVLRSTARNFGFLEVESPALEPLSLLTAKSGEEIKNQIFVLEKRSIDELGLRFDLTVPLTRMFVAKQLELPKPVKWFALSRMWRYEAPQKGRLREFYQLSCELFGSDKPEAVAECINLIIACLTNLGLAQSDFYVKVNNRKLLEGLLSPFVKTEQFEAVTRVIDKLSKLTKEEFAKELQAVGLSKDAVVQINRLVSFTGPAEKMLAQLSREQLTQRAREGLDELNVLCNLLPTGCATLDVSIARGLAYYTGTVFEVFDRDGEFRAIAGGGQYDQLTQLLGGQNTPAVGFAIGYSTLTLLLMKRKKLPEPSLVPDYVIIVVSEDVRKPAVELANRLRKKYVVEIDVMNRKLGKQLEYANVLGAKKAIFFGPDEAKTNKVRVKDLTTGEERIVGIATIVR